MKILPPPGPQRRRQLILLAITLVGLAVVAARFWQPADPAAATPQASNPQTRAAAPSVAPAPGAAPASGQLPEPLKLGALEPVPDAPEAGRNPFRFGVRPAPPPPPTPPVVAPPPKPEPIGPPPPPPIRLDLLGLVTMPEGYVVATLKDPVSNAVFQVREGQIIDGRYRLVKVGLQSVVVAHLDGTNPRTLPIR